VADAQPEAPSPKRSKPEVAGPAPRAVDQQVAEATGSTPVVPLEPEPRDPGRAEDPQLAAQASNGRPASVAPSPSSQPHPAASALTVLPWSMTREEIGSWLRVPIPMQRPFAPHGRLILGGFHNACSFLGHHAARRLFARPRNTARCRS
jgi:hypothetical protein